MSTTKVTHTPGPWSVGYTRRSRLHASLGDSFETAIHVGTPTNRGNCLAIVYIGGDGALDNSREAVEANARLIAAAPELLAALRECYAIVALQNGNLHDDINQIMNRARAAIASYEGE